MRASVRAASTNRMNRESISNPSVQKRPSVAALFNHLMRASVRAASTKHMNRESISNLSVQKRPSVAALFN